MQKAAAKRVDVLLLSELKYEDYLRYKAEQERELRSQQSPSSADTRPLSLQDDVSQRAEQLIATESETHFNKVLTSVGLKEVKERSKDKLEPINNQLPKFKDISHFRTTMNRLHSRTNSAATLPVSPATDRKPLQTNSRDFSSIKKNAEQRAAVNFDKLKDQIQRHWPETEKEALPSRPMSTQPYSKAETQASTVPATPTPKIRLTKRVLKHYMSEVATAFPFETERSTKATEGRKPLKMRKSGKQRKRKVVTATPSESSSDESSASASFLKGPNIYRHIEREKAVNWRENEAMRQQQYWKRVLKDIKSQYAKKKKHSRTESVGQLMEIMFRKKPEINEDEAKHGDIAKFRTLNEKLYKMMKEDPAELHRITTQPEFMVPVMQRKHLVSTSAQRQAEWTEEHEAAFKSLLRKTHSFNSIAKTRMFKEQEKVLPEKKTMRDMEWKYDLHSPWVNDLDYNGDEFLAVGEDMEVAPAKKSSISNIRRGYRPPLEKFEDPQEIEAKDLRSKTGLLYANLYRLRQTSKRMEERRDFEDAIAGFQMINTWEQHHHLFDEAKARLASHILAGSKIDMMMLNKARYSYLSAKIAHQRATNELTSKVWQEAEDRRKELKVRQEAFQRDVTVARSIVRRLYPTFSLRHRRVIKTTAHALGSPLFRAMMNRLGFLPQSIEAKPKRLRAFSLSPQVAVPLDAGSKPLLSHLNFQTRPETDRKLTKEETFEQRVAKAEASIQGFIVRYRVGKIRRAVRLWQKIYRRYRLTKVFLKVMMIAQEAFNTRSLASIIGSFRGAFVHKQITKELAAAKADLRPAAK